MNIIEFNDFYKVPNIKFDISKLKTDLEKILRKKKFNSLGIKNFGAIPLNQIPGDKGSTEGHNVRGTYWTLPDESGKEAMRDISIDESKYTELVPDFHKTYFEEVYDTLRKKFKLGRVRILLKEPRSTLSWHRDPEPRLHIPIITNLGCRMVIENTAKHMPADGTVTITNNTKYHNFFNGGEQKRIHLVACVLEDPFKKYAGN
ncbi:aspartyl/asparaginyl beta-hydroxylase domain-containing protein [Pelagibacteraceae bacterium]|nr:aspartyl/asparaginyl beta-hydroxylase domain-containing protein [Pelagibacteraceae bacterium]